MLVDAIIPSPHFNVPSVPRTIKNLVVHVTVDDCRPTVARSIARWFQTPMLGKDGKSHPASAHYVVGPDELIQCVDDKNIAWHACSPINEISIGVELDAQANWTTEQWHTPEVQQMLDKAADLFAWKCSQWNIPVQFVPAADLRALVWGITTHAEVTKAWHNTDHVDPGPNFLMSEFIAAINQKLTP